MRRAIAILMTALLVLCPAPREAHATPPMPDELSVIAFGSCAREDRFQPLWDHVLEQKPELFLFIGDNMYADIPDVPTNAGLIAQAYQNLGEQPGYQKLKQAVPILATWDDHDYGLNDAGKEWFLKDEAQVLLLSFFEEPADSPRWDRQGVYGSWTFGPQGQRVQVILLDTRYHRDPITRNPEGRVGGRGPYIPNEEGQGSLLGEAQWDWLAGELKKPAGVRIIGSSIQVVPFEHQWECWGNMPHERRKLYDLIQTTKANGVLFISGDRHLIEISKDTKQGTPYPMWDFTSSSMNWRPGQVNEPNQFRTSPVLREPNFGLIRINWDAGTVSLEGYGSEGKELMQQTVELSTLRVE